MAQGDRATARRHLEHGHRWTRQPFLRRKTEELCSPNREQRSLQALTHGPGIQYWREALSHGGQVEPQDEEPSRRTLNPGGVCSVSRRPRRLLCWASEDHVVRHVCPACTLSQIDSSWFKSFFAISRLFCLRTLLNTSN